MTNHTTLIPGTSAHDELCNLYWLMIRARRTVTGLANRFQRLLRPEGIGIRVLIARKVLSAVAEHPN